MHSIESWWLIHEVHILSKQTPSRFLSAGFVWTSSLFWKFFSLFFQNRIETSWTCKIPAVLHWCYPALCSLLCEKTWLIAVKGVLLSAQRSMKSHITTKESWLHCACCLDLVHFMEYTEHGGSISAFRRLQCQLLTFQRNFINTATFKYGNKILKVVSRCITAAYISKWRSWHFLCREILGDPIKQLCTPLDLEHHTTLISFYFHMQLFQITAFSRVLCP